MNYRQLSDLMSGERKITSNLSRCEQNNSMFVEKIAQEPTTARNDPLSSERIHICRSNVLLNFGNGNSIEEKNSDLILELEILKQKLVSLEKENKLLSEMNKYLMNRDN